MTSNSCTLFAAIYVADFPAQAILRLRQDLRTHPVAILDGVAPQEQVCSLNHHARKRGVIPGMSRLEVEELGGICVHKRSIETERNARTILLEYLSQFSPRIEETFAPNATGFVLDISGTERLFGSPAALAKRIQTCIHSDGGFRASIAVSHNFDTARIKAAFSRGLAIVPLDQEATSLTSISVAALPLGDEDLETFALWGILRLGDLAELIEEELIARLGQKAKHWLNLARGMEEHIFLPIEATVELREHIDFETPIENLESLMFIAAGMISSLITRASSRAMALACLTVQMDLEKSPAYQRLIRPAIPSSDRKFLLKLLQLEIAAHPPQAAIHSLTLIAESGQQSKVQMGLFAPQTPDPSRLDVTLARLKALVGDDRVGSPQLLDTNRPDGFAMEDFSVPSQSALRENACIQISLRRIRPPRPIRMQLEYAKPALFQDGIDRYCVQVAYGPWLTSGCWWSVDQWDLEEWDVLATNNAGDSIGCLIVHDHLKKQWRWDALYD
jgi:protein ImuB